VGTFLPILCPHSGPIRIGMTPSAVFVSLGCICAAQEGVAVLGIPLVIRLPWSDQVGWLMHTTMLC